ncbi:hypothetical protein Ancab_034479 [Ancistrocladus abbreviatus]
MTIAPSSPSLSPILAATLSFFLFFSLPRLLHALGSGSTIAVVYSTATVCGIVATQPTRPIRCYRNGQPIAIPIQPNISYDSVVGGRSFFCGLRSGGVSLLCWGATTNCPFQPKRIYQSRNDSLSQISVGDDQVCGVFNGTNQLECWRGMKGSSQLSTGDDEFRLISSGLGYSCGILMNNNQVRCWGNDSTIVDLIQGQFGNISMSTIVAGARHVCGFDLNRVLVCKGDNSSGQLKSPSGEAFSKLALGMNFSCGIRESNNSVVCWGGGGGGEYSSNLTQGLSFESIVAGLNFVCGLSSENFSVICWGPGWSSNGSLGGFVPLPAILPGPCVQSSCSCGIYPDSQKLCSGFGNICRSCGIVSPASPPSPPSQPPSPSSRSSPSRPLRKGLLAFAIVGSVGAFAGICTIVYCLYTGVCFGRKKIHNSVQPTITRAGSSPRNTSSNSPPLRSSTIRRQSSRAMRRQRSGTSSTKHPGRAEEFTFSELAAATNNFSLENKIGAGSFGVVYKGKLPDGLEVAIKRGETSPKTKKLQDKESAFESELAFLSRLHHKHLVRLVGYCEERDERLLVYEYMKNGALYDHLHNKNNVEKSNSFVNSWKTRISIALDAARGIEYLHNYAVPPIIHRDIKSSNILLDENWTARVSDFGLSLMGSESVRPSKAGTFGYIDPEYYGLNVLTTKSDVYGLGVVLLELLTGKKAIFKINGNNSDGGGDPMSVVDYAVPAIMAGELAKILDMRVGLPGMNESEAVELVAYTALHCVNLEGKDRPTMTDIVANLERASALCDGSHGSISSASISIGSD